MDFQVTPVVEQVIRHARITYKLGGEFTRSFPHPLTYMTMRDRFDNFLTERAVSAGATLLDGFKVNRVDIEHGSAEISGPKELFAGRVVVGADGANSTVAHQLGLLRGAEMAVGLESEVYTGQQSLEMWRSTVSLDFGTIRSGYMWVFPKEDHLSIGVGGYVRYGPRMRELLGRYLQSLRLGSFQQRLTRGHRLMRRRRGMSIQAGPALLLGDAAGLIDFWSGEGIYYALRSSQIAAPAICDYLEGKTADLRDYESSVDDELMPEIRIARTFARIGFCIPRLSYTMLKNSESAWKAGCQLLRAEKSYHDFRKKMGPFTFLLDIASLGS